MSKLKDAPSAYTFDDFTLEPVFSSIKSRKDPDISTYISNTKYSIPVVSSPMNTVTEKNMLVVMGKLGGIGVLHRYSSIENQIKTIKEAVEELNNFGIENPNNNIYVSVGANGDFEDRIKKLNDIGIKNFCVDVANGHSQHCIDATHKIRLLIPDSNIMSGNVCSYDGAHRLAEAGASCIRVGVGSGASCKTRVVTGHGIPQLSAVEDCIKIKNRNYDCFKKSFPEVSIISDGGIRESGDAVKSLAIGADAVMIGSLLAGSIETPGEVIEEDGKLYKYYHGMASEGGRAKWFDRSKVGLPAEGVSIKIPYVGKSAEKIIDNLCQSIKVGLSYSGANNLEELVKKAKWRKITQAGYIEGTPHGKCKEK